MDAIARTFDSHRPKVVVDSNGNASVGIIITPRVSCSCGSYRVSDAPGYAEHLQAEMRTAIADTATTDTTPSRESY